MKIELKVIPGAKRNEWVEEGQQVKVYLSAPAVEGRANEALIKFLTEHFRVKPYQVEIIQGLKSRRKVINIVGL